jgi:Flp pilus assembly protein TadB
MTTLIAMIGALALAAIPLAIGWRRPLDEAGMARALGLSASGRRFDPQQFARRTGTGLTFNQLLFGVLAWIAGGFAGGLFLSPLAALLFAIAAGLLYASGLSDRRQEFRLRQAKDILRGLGVVETLLGQGRPLSAALEEAAQAVGPEGQQVLGDLVMGVRAASPERAAQAVRDWTTTWEDPAVEIVGVALLAALAGRIEIGPLVASLRRTLSAVVEVLSRARAAARGIAWQARFLAVFPPGIMVLIAVVTPQMGKLYAANPLFLAPVLFGSGLSYLFSMRMIRNGLSIEASIGLQAGRQGEIRLDRLGRVL